MSELVQAIRDEERKRSEIERKKREEHSKKWGERHDRVKECFDALEVRTLLQEIQSDLLLGKGTIDDDAGRVTLTWSFPMVGQKRITVAGNMDIDNPTDEIKVNGIALDELTRAALIKALVQAYLAQANFR